MNELNPLARPAAEIKLVGFPIPAEQVLAGNPAARIWISAQSADGKVTQGVWDCAAGQFRWSYTWDEFILILEGEVTIESSGKKKVTLRAGDHAHFPLGLQAVWTVPKYVKKTFVLRTPEPLKL
jgi:uncharacterized cupin superfamily protein